MFPMNVNRILRLLSDMTAASPTMPLPDTDTAAPLLITSSPPEAAVLRNANTIFKEALSNTAIASPIKKHARQLSSVAERLHAENSILRHENTELKQIINKRKERTCGKRVILKGKVIITTEEVQRQLMEAERATKERKNKKRKKGHQRASHDIEVDAEDIEDCAEDEQQEIDDCIEVQFE